MKNIKGYIISFVLGAIVFSGVTVFASTLLSKDITFTPTKEDWQVSTVEEAINDLYDYSREDTMEKLLFTYQDNASYGYLTERSTSITLEKGNYIVILSDAATAAPKTVQNLFSDLSNNTTTWLNYSDTKGTCELLTLKRPVGTGNVATKDSGNTYYSGVQNFIGIYKCNFTDTLEISAKSKNTNTYENFGSTIYMNAIKLD